MAASESVPEAPLRAAGANVAESGCEPLAASVKVAVATENGGDAAGVSVTFAGALPVLTTAKFCVP